MSTSKFGLYCPGCRTWKPAEDYTRHILSDPARWGTSYCRNCQRAYDRAYRSGQKAAKKEKP